MPESISDADRALWRIAELGARCGQHSKGLDRRPMWEELERLITDLSAEMRTARAAKPVTTDGQLKGRLVAGDTERDQAAGRLKETAARMAALKAELQSARNERDAAVAERDAVLERQAAFDADFEVALEKLAARAEGAVFVLPQIAVSETESTIQTAARFS